MRFFLILIILASVYLFLAKRNSKSPELAPNSVSTAVEASSSTPSNTPAESNILKRPLDRTHAALDQARKNAQGGF